MTDELLMVTNQSKIFTVSQQNIAVLDFGVSTLKVVIVDPVQPEEPLRFQRIYLPLKTKKEEVEGVLKTLLRSYADYNIRKFIITTTGSFFSSAKESVEFVINSIIKFINPVNVILYSHDCKFENIKEALESPTKIVSAGWKALGLGLWELIKKDGLIVDFSTRSTSFIPIRNGDILSKSSSDFERIKKNELLFLGMLETNAAFIQTNFEYNGETYHLPFESHAITADVFLITNDLQPADYLTDTPDKKAKFKEDALGRIKTMFCLDQDRLKEQDLVNIAQLLKTRLLEIINQTIKKKLEENNLDRVILTGIGAPILYHYLNNRNENYEIIHVPDIIKTTEINTAFCLAYIYSLKRG